MTTRGHWCDTRHMMAGIHTSCISQSAGMATRTLKAKYETKDDSTGHVRQVFCASKYQKEIYY